MEIKKTKNQTNAINFFIIMAVLVNNRPQGEGEISPLFRSSLFK